MTTYCNSDENILLCLAGHHRASIRVDRHVCLRHTELVVTALQQDCISRLWQQRLVFQLMLLLAHVERYNSTRANANMY